MKKKEREKKGGKRKKSKKETYSKEKRKKSNKKTCSKEKTYSKEKKDKYSHISFGYFLNIAAITCSTTDFSETRSFKGACFIHVNTDKLTPPLSTVCKKRKKKERKKN
jgi:hypothetical protein